MRVKRTLKCSEGRAAQLYPLGVYMKTMEEIRKELAQWFCVERNKIIKNALCFVLPSRMVELIEKKKIIRPFQTLGIHIEEYLPYRNDISSRVDENGKLIIENKMHLAKIFQDGKEIHEFNTI